MKKLLLILVLAVALSGCGAPPPGGDEGTGGDLGQQTTWCNTTMGTTIAASAYGSGIINAIVEGVKIVEGKEMCSVKMDYYDEETGESGTIRIYVTQNEEDFIMEVYNSEGIIQMKMKNLGGQSQITIYDEQGNPVEIPGFT